MPWHIGQQVTPTNDITYIIEERLDTVYLFEKRRNPSTLYKATELSKDKSGVVKNVTVFIKCYDEDLSTQDDYNRSYENVINRQYKILLTAKTEREDLGIFKITDMFTYEYPYDSAKNETLKKSICFVLECREGQTLEQKVKELKASQNGLNLEDVLGYAKQISSVLDYFHTKNLALGLVVPSNVWITNSNEAFIINFDATWDIRNHEARSMLAQRTDFCPLNRKTGQADTITDIYSFGALLYFALTGIETHLIDEEYRLNQGLSMSSFSKYRNDIPKYIEDAILKSMDFNSKNRFDKIHNFRESLRLLDQEPFLPSLDSEEIVKRLINQVQTDVGKVFGKATDLNVKESPLETRYVSEFVTDMIRIIKYVDPNYSAHFVGLNQSTNVPFAQKEVEKLPWRYYFCFFLAGFSITIFPSLFIIPFPFPKNIPFLGFLLSSTLMAVSTVWLCRPIFIWALVPWLVASCAIISIANYWNFLYILAIIVAFSFLFKVFKESSNDAYSSLNRAITDLQAERAGQLSLDVFIAFASGIITTWIVASVFGRAG